jgi:hypothetical protein
MTSAQPHPSDDAAVAFSLALHLRSLLHTNGSDSREQLSFFEERIPQFTARRMSLGQGLNDSVNCEKTESSRSSAASSTEDVKPLRLNSAYS